MRTSPVTFVCSRCGEVRTGVRRRCYACTGHVPDDAERARVSAKLTGVLHSPERRQRIKEGRNRNPVRWPIGEFTRGKPSPKAKPIGSSRIENGHIKVKCPDGVWRYRARVMWEQANGPIPPARLIHHVNFDPFDDRLENFQLVTRAEHARIHMEGDTGRSRQSLTVAARKRNGTY